MNTVKTDMFIHAYLRASTDKQDATRAKEALLAFANEHGKRIASFYVENVSGTTLERPELFRLLDNAQPGDVILTEQIDRISRLRRSDWELLKGKIKSKGLTIVSMDLPTSFLVFQPEQPEFMQSLFEAMNSMMMDVLAAMANKDNLDRARRRDEGIAKAKAAGKYKGRPADSERKGKILKLRDSGHSIREIASILGCGVSTVQRALKVADIIPPLS